MYGRSTTPHCAQAMRQCGAGFPLPTAPRRSGSALHCPLPSAHSNLCPQQQCSRAHTVRCSAQQRAVQHHIESTVGAERHAGCSGPMRPCVTVRRRQQGSVGNVRECTGPAMQQHTARAQHTHSPARLPLPLSRHPGLLPFGNSACVTPQHDKTQHTTPNCATAHNGPTKQNATKQTTTQHITTQ